ncbi:Serine/threonine-protein kinase tnni3k [Polyrhizophydium stewartii]|uniref:Serine/threonine-protein kinase tnni3k n=1 Tax=Polyrhizophydium stewartii TaxID=2732419 RepID=A0ABR4NC32_9FUNG
MATDGAVQVTPDATVEHVRKRHDPDNVFTVPMVPELPTEGSLFEIMRRMRLDEKKMELNRKHHGGSAGAKSVYMSGTRGGLGSNGDPTSAGSADGSPAGEFSTETYDGIAQENDASVGQSPLHIAARRNSVRDIKLWIEAYSKNTLDNRDFTPLMVAASHNSVRAMVFLLRMGGVRKDDVDCKMQRTALHWAVFHGHAAAALTLLRYGADARFRDREGRTPVHLAAMHPRPACLRRILQFVNPSALLEGDNEQMTPLHLAVMSDNVRHLQIMLRVQPPIDITAGDVEGKTALHWCTQNTEPQSYAPTLFHKPVTCSKLLIESQPRLVGLTDLEGRTPLHLACSNANRPLIVEMCGQMIGTQVLKSIVNTQDIQGRTATHYAAISGHPYILRVLRHYGASEGLADRDGATALHYACAKNHGQCVSILISENRLYESYVRDNLGRTPVMWAAMKGCTEALRILLEAGVNPNEYDEKGATGMY